MQKLAEICIKRPVFATMMNLALVIVGIVGYTRLGEDRLPSVDVPTVNVRARLAGGAPEEVESEITDRLEEAVNTVEGIDELRSVSQAESCFVLANFNLKRDIDAATQDVRDRVSGVLRDLPRDVDPPTVSKVQGDSDPVMTVAVSGPRDQRELTEIADRVVRRQLERVSGVGEIRISGSLQRTVNIWVEADKLDALSIPITAIRDAVAGQNADVPGGNVTTAKRELTLRTAGRYLDAKGFNDLVIAVRGGLPIKISDIGRAEDGNAEQRTIARFNGAPTVVVQVFRQSDANTVAVIDGVKTALEALKPQLPADIGTTVILDQSRYIRAALAEIDLHLVLGSILASLVVLFFMRSWRSTLIAAVAIPTSVVATFGVMYALGFTLNSVTMLALVLMVGIVIDDAIVVLENIFRFIEEKGMEPAEAAREATREIGLAVLATTLSLVVIFVPVSFMSSVAGRFLYQFGITAAVAIMVSLFVSFTLTPTMAARLLRRPKGGHGAPSSKSGFYGLIDRGYTFLVRWSMKLRWLVLILALAIIATSVPMFESLGREFTPTDVDEAEFSVGINAPEGTSVVAMDEAMVTIEKEIRSTPGVTDVLGTTGGFSGRSPNQGDFYVRIEPHSKRVFSLGRLWRGLLEGSPGRAFEGNYSQSDVMEEINRRVERYKDVRVLVRNFQAFNIGGGPFDVNFLIRGPELEKLAEYAEALRDRARAGGGFRGLDTTLRLNKPEVRVSIDRERAADLGIQARDIGQALRLMVGGDEEISRFRDPESNEQYDVRLRLETKDRDRPEILERLKLPRQGGGLVELGTIAKVERVKTASRIDRLDRQRVVSVRGGTAPGYDLGGRITELRRLASELGMPATYTTAVTGRSRELERTFDEFILAFLLSVVFMYLILASQFESVVHPITILISLPLSVPFALFSLQYTSGTLNVFSALGILVLFGVVKKNSILQIDHMNQLREKGLPRLDAIIQGNRDRLRPILMTTLSLVAGMLPLALGSGPGAEERRAVAVVVIGGQSLCLLLTLLVTPVVYSILDDLGALFRKRR